MPRSPDPLGKRALFWAGEPGDGAVQPAIRSGADGKSALFSGGRESSGPVAVTCSSCNETTELSPVAFARRLPFSVWAPWRKHQVLLVCPSCDRRTWVAVRWTG